MNNFGYDVPADAAAAVADAAIADSDAMLDGTFSMVKHVALGQRCNKSETM